MKSKVIIPSAKIVPKELQKLGKLPGIIYPINQRIVFDYLYEEYKDVCSEMHVICYEKADEVRRRLDWYPEEKVKFKVLPELSDLGYTVHYGLEGIDGPVIINFADTIVMDVPKNAQGGAVDAFFCQEDFVSDTWTYFDEEDGELIRIYDKESINFDGRKQLFAGVFLIADGGYFRNCLEQAFHEKDLKMDSFYYALMLYSRKHRMRAIRTSEWFDIGHADRYYNSKLGVRAREFNHITVDKDRGILRKSSDDKDKFIGEIRWYLKLPADVEYARPRIFDYSTRYEAPYISMEYYAYHTVHELFLFGELSQQQWVDIFNRIRFVCDDFSRYSVKGSEILPSLKEMYYTKTLRRLGQMKENSKFQSFFERPVTVNGKTYCSLNEVSEILRKIIPGMLYDVDTFYLIHGDLCFANIMVDSNLSFVKVIDPRGKFGAYDIYGDPRYELAKLFHSVDGKYDYIIKDIMDVTYDLTDATVDYMIHDRERGFDICDVFVNSFKNEIGKELKKIELIESLLFLSMIPLHAESLDHQMAMLGTGLDILGRVVDITVGGGEGNVQ